MKDCFIRSVFTALTLPEISFLIPVFQLVLVYRLLPFFLFMWPHVHHDRGSQRGSRRVLRDKYGDSHATRDSFVSIRHLALRVFEPKEKIRVAESKVAQIIFVTIMLHNVHFFRATLLCEKSSLQVMSVNTTSTSYSFLYLRDCQL